jgi:hypothetical protein
LHDTLRKKINRQQKNSQIWLYILQQQESCHIDEYYQYTFEREVGGFGWCVGLVFLISPCCSSFLLNLSTSFAATDAYSRLFLSPWIVNLRYSFGISILLIPYSVIEINSKPSFFAVSANCRQIPLKEFVIYLIG